MITMSSANGAWMKILIYKLLEDDCGGRGEEYTWGADIHSSEWCGNGPAHPGYSTQEIPRKPTMTQLLLGERLG
jgi:hypothetical protein